MCIYIREMIKKNLILVFDGDGISYEFVNDFKKSLENEGFIVEHYFTKSLESNFQLAIEITKDLMEIGTLATWIYQLLKHNKSLILKNRTTSKKFTKEITKEEIEKEIIEIYEKSAF